MPPKNRFRHQEYGSKPKHERFVLLKADPPVPFDSGESRRRMRAIGDIFRHAGVAAVYLLHGTFVGEDALGWFSEIARVWPAFGDLLREQQKRMLDSLLNDVGNYTAAFANAFEEAINDAGNEKIPVRLFHWSGENHHIGRADGAIRLLAEIRQVAEQNPHRRVLLWGHSHAGNVFALMTNLLACDAKTRRKFFTAARSYYEWPLIKYTDVPVWREIRNLLNEPEHPFQKIALDFVTFGTPIRYGWDSNGYSKLLHFVAHRPDPKRPPHLATFPPTPDDVQFARGGDYIQQFGIAGTNFLPNLIAWRDILADRRLNQFLQPGLPPSGLLTRLKMGMRVADDGETLLVDYGPMNGSIYEHLLGHAVYTKLEWLTFHAEQIANRFYRVDEGKLQNPE